MIPPCESFPDNKPKSNSLIDQKTVQVRYFREVDDARIVVNRVGIPKKWRVYAKNKAMSL